MRNCDRKRQRMSTNGRTFPTNALLWNRHTHRFGNRKKLTIAHSPYYLAKHAFTCFADHHMVFLDLQTDEYSCLGREDSDAVRDILTGDGETEVRRTDNTDDTVAGAVVDALLQKGLLVRNEADGKQVCQPSVAEPIRSTASLLDGPVPDVRPSHVWNFFAACARASCSLRWNSIERTVRGVQKFSRREIVDTHARDESTIIDLFRVYRGLRPFYPRPYLCMFDSLSLVLFLASYDVYPQWVYGVKIEPFAAHCWVQAGGLVVNDIVDNVREYTPIMSV